MIFLSKLKYILPLNAKILIYSYLISSYFNFNILDWGYQYDRLVKLQKPIVRIVSTSKCNAPTEPIL